MAGARDGDGANGREGFKLQTQLNEHNKVHGWDDMLSSGDGMP